MTRSCNITLFRSIILVPIFYFLYKSAEISVILNLFIWIWFILLSCHTQKITLFMMGWELTVYCHNMLKMASWCKRLVINDTLQNLQKFIIGHLTATVYLKRKTYCSTEMWRHIKTNLKSSIQCFYFYVLVLKTNMMKHCVSKMCSII